MSIGGCDGAVRKALAAYREAGVSVDYMRIRAFPFHDEVQSFIDSHDQIFVVEQNRDAQLKTLLVAELEAPKSKLPEVLHFNGMPITASVMVETITATLKREKAA